ncbi:MULTISPECIES: antiholin-like murein hydrolase modulator LrgA [Brochothrix]|uniref:Antiholin LrgA n=1 Tax=Brochothrix thermosphacta TaxID=2756 RepID=A0A1D2LK17_BROTH|nr:MULTISPECIES: antiholin-like murein hydrolase modulator LrgA [Brochothrix]SLM96509.1 Antiholin-like protein LrgA [Brachybacterium faecium]ANZ97811.1 antiholin LrgA [Brochothrix thermosphacta]ATF24978.1 antiholin LrgA [Brochothrix thermosphacta]ATH84394.1 antiholin LrgA [Brochothrix thermosphacta]EUJ37877.1 murein hydrolase regulator LrgA [Brochothrix thermosphacta DSM 20171 = FSL F6-1036]
MKNSKAVPFLQQAFIFAIVMLVANIIKGFLPMPMPASAIGLILLFIALSTKIVKVEQVEGLGNKLISIISFLFVPAAISVINSLGILSTSGLQIMLIIIVATVILLAITGWSTQVFLKKRAKTHRLRLNSEGSK